MRKPQCAKRCNSALVDEKLLLEALRKWQKSRKSRRKPLSALAVAFRSNTATLGRKLLGLRKRIRKNADKKVAVTSEERFASKIKLPFNAISQRAVRRLREPTRREEAQRKRRVKHANRVLPFEHEELSQRALEQLEQCRYRRR